jgi:hypothetical protein
MFSFDQDSLSIKQGNFAFSNQGIESTITIPLEGNVNTVFCCPIMKTPCGRWRMYYLEETGDPGYAFKRVFCIDSEDGVNWNSSIRNKIVCEGFDLDSEAQIRLPSVFIDKSGKWVMYAWLFYSGMIRYIRLESVDGINWIPLNVNNPCLYHPNDIDAGGDMGGAGLTPGSYYTGKKNSISEKDLYSIKSKMSNDSTCTYYDEEKDCFELYSVWLADNPPSSIHHVPYDNAPDIRRIIQRRTSSDGFNWSSPEIIITPDENDPDAMQFYYMNITMYENWKIGMLGRYPCIEQIIEPEICFSRDGIVWERPYRKAWLERSGFDVNVKLIHTSHHFVDFGDHWKVFYNSSYFKHDDFLGESPTPRRREIRYASIPQNRFLGLKGEGCIVSKAFIYSEGCLMLDVDIHGYLKAELLDINGNPISGHGTDNMKLIDENKNCKRIMWNCDDSERLIFHCCQLKLTGSFCLYRVITKI